MTTSNNTQKLFTTPQLVGIIAFSLVVIAVGYMLFSGDFSSFNSVGLGK